MFNERIAKQNRLKPITIQYELGDAKSTKEVTITSVAQMQQLIDAAVAKDITNIDRATSYVSPSWVHLLKTKKSIMCTNALQMILENQSINNRINLGWG